ncbi:MAG: PIN domain-containing protein [Acidobacteriota bacterium]|nr:PIN domain-containing protein [Acidobacteriota bacterium]
MMRVFADSSYWIALLDPRDELHSKAVAVTNKLGAPRILTTEMVLVELLNSFSGGGPAVRGAATGAVEGLRRDANVIIEPQTPEQFDRGLQYYAQARDKDWSLTDCVSFQVMEEQDIRSVLTHDRHFEQAGYDALLR